jgi:sulfatase-like protein
MTDDSTPLGGSAPPSPGRGGGLGGPWRARPLPFHPLLLAAYPVLFLYGQNLGELSIGDLPAPLAVILAAALVALVVGAYILRDARRAALVVSALAAMFLLFGHLSPLLVPFGVRAGLQQVGWALFIGAVAVLALRIGSERLSGLTRALNIVTALLVVFALVTIVPGEAQRFGRSVGPEPTVAVGGAAGPGRDIWFLVFDRYGSATSLQLMYDIDDRPFVESLRARGFQVAPDAHANYVKTTLSLAATLNLDYLDDLVAAEGKDSPDHGPINERLANHAVGRFLKERGYQYVHVGTNYGPTASSPLADRNLRFAGPSDFVGALYDTSALPWLARRVGIPGTTDRERRYSFTTFQLDALDELASDPSAAGNPNPTFVYAHVMLPHPPYIFAPGGSFVTETADAGRSDQEGYAEQLRYLHARMDAIVDQLLARPEAERPIIILTADEGPYPPAYARDTVGYDWATATTDELEIKYGILDAMYLPGDAAPQLPPTITAVNTFRLIFGAYFGADLPLLPDRSYTSASKLRPYDLTDITDRLPPP